MGMMRARKETMFLFLFEMKERTCDLISAAGGASMCASAQRGRVES
jgi:NADH:ubiquinone oxidoreductase subunit D